MGIANRHSGAPFIDGESPTATELEQDVSSIYGQFGGQIEDVNVVPDAQIEGSKLLAESVSGTRIKSLALDAAKVATDAVTEGKLQDAAVVTSHLSSLAGEAVTHADQDVNTVLLAQDGSVTTETAHNTLVFTPPTETHVVLFFGSAIYNTGVTTQALLPDTWRIKKDALIIVQKRHQLMDNFTMQNSFGGPNWRDWVSLVGIDSNPTPGVPVTYTLTSQRGYAMTFGTATFNYQESVLVAVALRR